MTESNSSQSYIHSKEQWPPVAARKVRLGISAAVGAVAQADYRIFILEDSRFWLDRNVSDFHI